MGQSVQHPGGQLVLLGSTRISVAVVPVPSQMQRCRVSSKQIRTIAGAVVCYNTVKWAMVHSFLNTCIVPFLFFEPVPACSCVQPYPSIRRARRVLAERASPHPPPPSPPPSIANPHSRDCWWVWTSERPRVCSRQFGFHSGWQQTGSARSKEKTLWNTGRHNRAPYRSGREVFGRSRSWLLIRSLLVTRGAEKLEHLAWIINNFISVSNK